MQDIIDKFKKLFDGYELAYGQHSDFIEAAGGKMNGRAQTIPKNLPDTAVENHLTGKGASLGIVPLKSNNKVKFGAIDIDIKHPVNPLIHTIEEIEQKIIKLTLPLVACQSKSKGIHLYCFAKEEIDASLMVKRLKEWAGLLGYGSSEIFPKQTHRLDAKDIGNWINMPYFDYQNTKRYAINKGDKLSIEQFFDFAEASRAGAEELTNFKIESLDDDYNDAPPCLQTIVSLGVEEGSRNNGLYNFAVYYRNKYPDNYEDKVMEINAKIFSPILKLKEVEGVIKAVQKKEFFYKCNEYPICQFCNKSECFNRKFGIGNSSMGTEIAFDNLTKYISSDDSVRWYAEMQGQRIQLTTDELLNQKLLQKKLLDATNKIFQPMKAQKWIEVVDNLLKSCVVYEDPTDASKKGQFKELLDTFLTDGVAGTKRADLLKFNTYMDESENLIYFKSSNLFTYLKNKRYNYTEQEIWHWIKELGGNSKQMKISNKRIRVWFMPAPEFYKEEEENRDLI